MTRASGRIMAGAMSGSVLGRIVGAMLACAAGLVLCVMPSAAHAETRLALVIGNSSYQSLKALKNPANDAGDIAAALKARGFEVIQGIDVGGAEMRRLAARFVDQAKRTDVSLVYYAGHGFQVASQNYLVPVDAVIRSRQDVAAQTVALRSLIDPLDGTPGSHLVFLDACRNNPLRDGVEVEDPTLLNGLARIGDAASSFIAYATRPDNVAFDGGGRNSPFAQALLGQIGTRGQDINAMMIAVRNDVLAATGGFQRPSEISSLTRQFYFAPGQPASLSPETQLWQLANAVREPALMRIYLSRYPEGAHAAEAQSAIKVASLTPASGAVRSTPDSDRVADDPLWDLAQRSRMRPLVEFYLARNPDGRHAPEARQLLQSLPSAADIAREPATLCERSATHPRDATANTPGVPLGDLARNAETAIAACREARGAHPETPHFTALLARALAAAGRREEAVAMYREAAERGNLRAMVSLGLLMETGDGLPKDPKGAVALYERAAEAGSSDAAINLAVDLMQGIGTPKNPRRAVDLLRQAADAGSAIATYNLGVLTQEGVAGDRAGALELFVKATELGDPRGYVPAAILLDEGRGTGKDPAKSAEMLLRGVASDTGEALSEVVQRSGNWSNETIRALQARLKRAGYYAGQVDGRGGTKMAAALERWRRVGSLELGQ